ncbi:MAG: N-6 DNA methylase [Bacteroidetes bacterium]|nr:N-6 DNA methylase [Bacteroidota bacterium]
MQTTFEEAYTKVKVLAENFQLHSNRFLRPDYKEHEVREDFINPFFEALGWDVSHKHQRDPFRQEVKGEKTEKEGRVDYSFFKAPDFKNPVFFVEAKKPSVDIKNELHYLQTIKYAWNAGLPVSILTDFQQLHILDCRSKAKAGNGSAFIGDHKEYVFTDYLDEKKFAEIYYTFSREALEQGNLETYIGQLRKPKGKAVQTGLFKGAYRPVDEDFLAYIDDLREELAKALKKNNEELESEELTEATQRIIDRLVFIRFLEDKEILDDYLVDKFGEKGSSWADFISTCLRLNTEYNGVVFKKHFIDEKSFDGPDEKMFRDICQGICHRNTDYNFRYIPIHILGSIYERFLGKVVHATDKRVKIEEKPEVRKAGGVYYTPKYIVEYIVDNTVGKIIGSSPSPSGRAGLGLSPKEISKLRFADIACGSGSFLISVYEHLLDYHTVYYNQAENIVAAQKDGCRKDEDGVWQLSIEIKQNILRNNIYGVDIDAQAVEVTQLSLYLKMLENENVVTVAKHLQKKGRLFGADKILPDLSNNIKCGNSLIGSDILHGKLFEDAELKKLNPFDYEVEFPHIFKSKSITKALITKHDLGIDETQNVDEPVVIYNANERGGFDAVVGNPPYGFHQIHTDAIKPYLKNHFESSLGSFENYFLFYERSLKLVRPEGLHGFIAPVTWLTIPSAKSLRKFILNNYFIKEIIWLPDMVFKNAQVNTLISTIQRRASGKTVIKIYDTQDLNELPQIENLIEQKKFIDSDYYIGIFENNIDQDLLEKILSVSQPLKTISRPCSGYNPYEVGSGKAPNGKPHTLETVKTKPYHSETKKGEDWKPEIVGRDLIRYGIAITEKRWVKYGPWLSAPRDPNNFIGKRILVQEITGGKERRIVAVYYDRELYHSRDVIPIKIEDDKVNSLFILGIINSKLLTWYHHKRNPKAKKGLFPKILVSDLKNLPIRIIDIENEITKTRHDHIVRLVEQMLSAKKNSSEAKTDKDKEFYSRQCEALDKQIDDAVFELYGLTEEEKQVVLNS